VTGANAIAGEADLTYDGTTLKSSHATGPSLNLTATSGGPYNTYVKMAGNDMEIRGSSGQIEFYTGNADGDSSTLQALISSNGEITQKGSPYASPTASMNISGGNVDIADDTTITMTDVANTGAFVDVGTYRRDGGSITYANALFYLTYGSTNVVKVADPRDIFANSDTDGKVCVYKGSNTSATFTIKNRMGSTANKLSVSVIRFSGL